MNSLTSEDINTLIETQLGLWREAKMNYDNLAKIRRKPLKLGDLNCAVQLNPARIRSTGAAVDAASIASRPCFLCKSNRPAEQLTTVWPDQSWELLINPFPILPVHFTIVSREHRPQDMIPFEMATMAEMAPELVIFFNGARAGASAPDHAHCQAVLKSELPLISLAEHHHPSSSPGWLSSEVFDADLPFQFLSAVITPDLKGMEALAKVQKAFGVDKTTGEKDSALINAFFWISDKDRLLRIIIIPRSAHRPSHYFRNGQDRLVVSPGAIDMAGLLITPREDDFMRITPDIAREIYAETALSDHLPAELISIFLTKPSDT